MPTTDRKTDREQRGRTTAVNISQEAREMMLPQLLLILGITWTTVSGVPCTRMLPSQTPPSNVNIVRPTDVKVLSSIGLHGKQLSEVVSNVEGLMTRYSPALVRYFPHEPSSNNPEPVKPSTLLEQAKDVSVYLQNSKDVVKDSDWKLLLFFVNMDQLCACDQQQARSAMKEMIKEVDEALVLLQSQLKRTIVSVALWDAEQDSLSSKMCSCMETVRKGEAKFLKATLTQAVQESLNELVVSKNFYGDRDDFTVILQDTPFIADLSSLFSGKTLSESEAAQRTDNLMVQMWTNLLQPTGEQPNKDENGKILALPCPTQDKPYLRTVENSQQPDDASALLSSRVGTTLSCSNRSPSSSVPTSVHKLRPADIKVVAAVGDSLTAGNGIASASNDIMDVLTEYRGLSWSIGGDSSLSSVTTLPNILRQFNKNLKGFSTGTGNNQASTAYFNQAVPGAISSDIPGQLKTLVSKMKSDSKINFNNDWKVITIFIGGNDLCASCEDSSYYSASKYIGYLREGLDYLHSQVPRALVNLVEPLQISPLRQLHKDTSLGCPTWLATMLCSCVISPADNSAALSTLAKLNADYQSQVRSLVNSKRYDTRSDFTVVVQPFLRTMKMPTSNGRPDRSYFSADCFHLSEKSQAQLARALWNNMLEPLNSKTTSQNFAVNLSLKCPTTSAPYIRTSGN